MNFKGKALDKAKRVRRLAGPSGTLLAAVTLLAGALAPPAFSAVPLREPPTMSREEVQSGLRARQRAMEVRQELRRLRQQHGRGLGIAPGRNPIPRLPRDPGVAPPPAALP